MATQTDVIRVTRGMVRVAELEVKTESANERALATVRELTSRKRTPKRMHFCPLLVDQIEKFESRTYPSLGYDPTPADTIRFLMEQNGLSQKDMWALLGGKSHASEVVNGKRKVNNRQAGLLGKRFKISPSAFINFDYDHQGAALRRAAKLTTTKRGEIQTDPLPYW
jgi:HTH-type transcriptional regulator / antitoxin HigA